MRWYILLFFITGCLVGLIILVAVMEAKSQNVTDSHILAREEQIQTMAECLVDAYETWDRVGNIRLLDRELAITFFYYRTGMMPVGVK